MRFLFWISNSTSFDIGISELYNTMILLNFTIFHCTIICFWHRIYLKTFENLYQQVEFSSCSSVTSPQTVASVNQNQDVKQSTLVSDAIDRVTAIVSLPM